MWVVEVLANGKKRKDVDVPHTIYFRISKKFGIAASWARCWRYRVFLHKASFQGEGILLRLLDCQAPVEARLRLCWAWVAEVLWRRSGEAAPKAREHLSSQLLSLPVERLVETNWSWCVNPCWQSMPAGLRGQGGGSYANIRRRTPFKLILAFVWLSV